MTTVEVADFARISVKQCIIPDDPYYVPSHIKDVELAQKIRTGDTVRAIDLLLHAKPVLYTHDMGFYYPRDWSKIRAPPVDCLTPLCGYVRAALLALYPPLNMSKPYDDVLDAILSGLPRPEAGTAESYDAAMTAVSKTLTETDRFVTCGRSCISDLSLLSFLRHIPWIDGGSKEFFLKKHEARYAKLDDMKAVEGSWRRCLYIDDYLRRIDFEPLIKFLIADMDLHRNTMIKKFIEEDTSSAFPYYCFGWFRCLMVILSRRNIKFFTTAFSFNAEGIALDAQNVRRMPEYSRDFLTYPSMPYSPGTRGHYFARWVFAIDEGVFLDPLCKPEMFFTILKTKKRSREEEADITAARYFSSWQKF